MNHPDAVEILLVEDNSSDVELTLRALEKNRLANNIRVLRDGEEALDFFFGDGNESNHEGVGRPKVILLDLKLPKVDGITVLRRLKADERTRQIPVVILTSSEEEKDIINSYTFGVNSYIVKPIDFAKFVDAIGQLGLYWLVMNRQP